MECPVCEICGDIYIDAESGLEDVCSDCEQTIDEDDEIVDEYDLIEDNYGGRI